MTKASIFRLHELQAGLLMYADYSQSTLPGRLLQSLPETALYPAAVLIRFTFSLLVYPVLPVFAL